MKVSTLALALLSSSSISFCYADDATRRKGRGKQQSRPPPHVRTTTSAIQETTTMKTNTIKGAKERNDETIIVHHSRNRKFR